MLFRSSRLILTTICLLSVLSVGVHAEEDRKPFSDLFRGTTVVDLQPIVPQRVLTRFAYLGKQRDILVSDEFKQAYPQKPYKDKQGFSEFTFYVYPLLSIQQAQLDEAFAQKRQVGQVGVAGTPLYQMSMNVALIDDGLRKAAAEQINRQFVGANVRPTNIALVPLTYTELRVNGRDAGDWSGTIATFPPIEAGSQQIFQPSSLPVFLNVAVTGTEEVLEAVRSTSRIEGYYYLSGFQIKQNVVGWGLANVAALGYHHFLTGDARWSDLGKYRSVQGGALVKAGPVRLGSNAAAQYVRAERSSWVARNQVKDVINRVASELRGTAWQEYPLDGEILTKLSDKMLDRLLESATRIDAAIDLEKKEVVDRRVLNDLAPDQIASLNSHVVNQMRLFSEETVKSGDQSRTQKDEYDGKSDMTWGLQGKTIIPKSIRLYQMNDTLFSSLTRMSFTNVKATHSPIRVIDRATFVRQKRIEPTYKDFIAKVPVEVLQASHISGGDEDLDSGDDNPTTFTLQTETSFNADQISVTSTARWIETDDDYTVLGVSFADVIKRKGGLKIVDVMTGQQEVNLSYAHPDQWHHFEDLSGRLNGGIYSKLRVRGDGGGDDHRGNSRFYGEIALKYRVLLTEGSTLEVYEER